MKEHENRTLIREICNSRALCCLKMLKSTAHIYTYIYIPYLKYIFKRE